MEAPLEGVGQFMQTAHAEERALFERIGGETPPREGSPAGTPADWP